MPLQNIKTVTIAELASIMLRGEKGIMAIIAFAGDDSGDSNRKELIAAGGFAARPPFFFEAERRWQRRLEQDGLCYFRATECANLRGEFQKFRSNTADSLDEAHAKADKIRDDLIEILNTSEALAGISITLSVPDFEEVLASDPRAKNQYGDDADILTYRRLIVSVLEMIAQDVGRNEVIAFEFDDHSNWRKAEQAYEVLRGSVQDPYDMLGHIGHGDDKKIPALQMADLMAYEARFCSAAWLEGRPLDRPTFKALSDDRNRSGIGYMGMITKQHLLSGLDAFDKQEEQNSGKIGA